MRELKDELGNAILRVVLGSQSYVVMLALIF